jgi:MFS family permease
LAADAALKRSRAEADADPMRVPEPLHLSSFRRLAFTYTVNELSWAFGTVALGILVFDRTGSAVATTALFLLTTFVPAIVGPPLTARLDHLAIRRALPALYVAEAAVFAALALLTDAFWLPAVLALALVDGAIALVARALTRAAVASALEPSGSLEAGNRLLNVCSWAGYAVGPAVAGLVVAEAGVAASLWITTGLFALIMAALATCRTLPAAHGEGDRSWRARLAESVRWVSGERTVMAVLAAHGAATAFLAFGMPIEVVYVEKALGAGSFAYGLLLTAWGAGTVVSSLVLARARGGSALALIPVTAAMMGAGYLIMAAAPGVALAAAGCLIGGLGNGVYVVSVIQAIQDRVPSDMQARVMSLFESLTAGAFGVGFLAAGAIAALAGTRVAYGVAAIGVLLSAAAIGVVLRERAVAGAAPRAGLSSAAEPAG